MKPPAFQAFEIQPKSITIPFQDLYPVPVSVAEYKYGFHKWIKGKGLFYQYHQAIYGFSHVRWSTAYIYRL
jgi:hypothetical protein